MKRGNGSAFDINLTDRSYQRNFATHHNVSDLLDFLWKEDAHSCNTERLRLQLAIYIGILADTGARLGSFTRSECYREKDDSLKYKVSNIWALYEPQTNTAPPRGIESKDRKSVV